MDFGLLKLRRDSCLRSHQMIEQPAWHYDAAQRLGESIPSLSQSPDRFVVGNLRALKSSRFSFPAIVGVGAG
jgi:hypothetical protein